MRVIINADDFGVSRDINVCIYRALEGGWITSATLLAGASRVEEAVEMCADFKRASFGAHLALDGPYNVGLIDNSVILNRAFRGANKEFVKNFTSLSAVNDIADEYARQIEKLLSLGLNISHLDSHHHLHLYLPALLGLIKAAKRFNIKKIRSLVLPAGQSAIKRLYRRLNYFVSRAAGFSLPDCYCDFPIFLSLGQDFKRNRTIEIMCHPGLHYNDEQYFNKDFYNSHLKGNLISYYDL
jgi:predicted glycoside hydrolase/deacetylase ChbG (UPF0249 family)